MINTGGVLTSGDNGEIVILECLKANHEGLDEAQLSKLVGSKMNDLQKADVLNSLITKSRI